MKIQWIHQFGWQSNRKCLRAPIWLKSMLPCWWWENVHSPKHITWVAQQLSKACQTSRSLIVGGCKRPAITKLSWNNWGKWTKKCDNWQGCANLTVKTFSDIKTWPGHDLKFSLRVYWALQPPASSHVEDFLGIWDDEAPLRSQQSLPSRFLITLRFPSPPESPNHHHLGKTSRRGK